MELSLIFNEGGPSYQCALLCRAARGSPSGNLVDGLPLVHSWVFIRLRAGICRLHNFNMSHDEAPAWCGTSLCQTQLSVPHHFSSSTISLSSRSGNLYCPYIRVFDQTKFQPISRSSKIALEIYILKIFFV